MGSGFTGEETDRTEVRDLRRHEVAQAVAVIARGMRDNPLHVAAYGPDPERREQFHGRVVEEMLGVSTTMQFICAARNGTVVGVTVVAPAGTCQLAAQQRMSLLPRLAALGPASAARVLKWTGSWADADPAEPHIHLGPLAVDTTLQGQGIGSLIMDEHCRRLDAADEVGYLETDKPGNVGFYQRFGYTVTAEARVIGIPNWFMRRPASNG